MLPQNFVITTYFISMLSVFFFSHFLDDKILADMKSLEGFLSLATNTVSGS